LNNDRFLGELLRMLLDDLRPPLVSIIDSLGAMRLLESRGEHPALAQLSRVTLHQSERLLRVIDTLLNILRDGEIKLLVDTCSVNDLIARAAAGFPTESLNIRNGVPDRVNVAVDLHLFTQVLVDLFEVFRLYGEREVIVSMLPPDGAETLTLTFYAASLGALAPTLTALYDAPRIVTDRRRVTRLAFFCRMIMAAHEAQIGFEGGAALMAKIAVPSRAIPSGSRRYDVRALLAGFVDSGDGLAPPPVSPSGSSNSLR
jgi:K+-sensing histidine kinase KdpD